MKILKHWKPFLIAFIILYGSISSGESIKKVSFFHFTHSDKIVHFLFYLTLSISILTSFVKHSLINYRKLMVLTFIIAINYGILMELIQYYFTINRSAEIADGIFNTLGCISGILIFPLLKKTKLYRLL